MNKKLEKELVEQLILMKSKGVIPNFSELSRQFHVDRRTVKKYYDGYEGKARHHKKSSKLDIYYDEIKERLSLYRGPLYQSYNYFRKKSDNTIGTYSNFRKYVISKNLYRYPSTLVQKFKDEQYFGYVWETEKATITMMSEYKENDAIKAYKYKYRYVKGYIFEFENQQYVLYVEQEADEMKSIKKLLCYVFEKLKVKPQTIIFSSMLESFQKEYHIPPILDTFMKEHDIDSFIKDFSKEKDITIEIALFEFSASHSIDKVLTKTEFSKYLDDLNESINTRPYRKMKTT